MSDRPNSKPTRISVTDLTPEHLAALEWAMSNVLSTNIALETLAQIVDGLPTRHIYRDYYGSFQDDFDSNLEPSQEAKQAVEVFRTSFCIGNIQIDAKVAQEYQNTLIGSRNFSLRLMEVAAILCHDIAATLFVNAEGGLRKPNPADAHRSPPPVPPDGVTLMFPIPPKPTELFHPAYQDWDQYPAGVADVVGYWAEYRLFGGVILFDRGESGTECKDVFIHPVRNYRIFQLSEAQIRQFVDFTLSEPTQNHETSQGLRFQPERYARRIDPYDAMSLHIYRNEYERKIPSTRPVHCVIRGDDDPEYAEALVNFVSRSENREPQ